MCFGDITPAPCKFPYGTTCDRSNWAIYLENVIHVRIAPGTCLIYTNKFLFYLPKINSPINNPSKTSQPTKTFWFHILGPHLYDNYIKE